VSIKGVPNHSICIFFPSFFGKVTELHSMSWQHPADRVCQDASPYKFFFCLFMLACDLSRSWRRTFYPVFLSAVRAWRHVASSPCALRQGPPEESECTLRKETKEKRKESAPVTYSSPADALKVGVGRNNGSQHPAPPPPPSAPPPAPAGPRASDTSLLASLRRQEVQSDGTGPSLNPSPYKCRAPYTQEV